MPRNLVIAYIVTWVVHIGYWLVLWRKNERIKSEWNELKSSHTHRARG